MWGLCERCVDGWVKCIRQCEVLFDTLYSTTGDKRFYSAREALIHGLDDDLLSVDVGLL